MYMNSLNTGLLNFIALCRYCSFCFYELKVYGNFVEPSLLAPFSQQAQMMDSIF